MKRSKPITSLAMLLALAAGCSSNRQVEVDESADKSEHNRLLVRMALAENVYNGNAANRAVYPRDFHYGSAALNPLGEARLRMLIDAYACGTARIVVIRGDEPDPLHDQRIDAVRQRFADAGFEQERLIIDKDAQLSDGSSSGWGLVSFDRLMSTYRAKPNQSAAPQGAPASSFGSN